MVQISRLQMIVIALICALGLLLSLPNLFRQSDLDRLPSWVPVKKLSLGLDLQGGSHLLLEVDLKAVQREWLSNLSESVRATILRDQRIAITDIAATAEAVTFKMRDPQTYDRIRGLLLEMDRGLDIRREGADTVALRITDQSLIERRNAVLEQAIQIVRKRIDETGTREPTIQFQGRERILVQLPGIDDPERIKRLLGRTAKMTFQLVDETASADDIVRGRAPPGADILPTEDRGDGGKIAVGRRVYVGGDRLTSADATVQDGQPVVSFRFDAQGGKQFGDVTRANVGKRLAIVLDGRVISAPVLREPILGGSGVISGSFTVQTARDLAILLRAGALPAPLNIIEERTVGAELGADSIRAGVWACAFAFALVAVFMVMYYGLFGSFAIIALVWNFFLILAAMSLLQASLTLPGIAGIVLTLGMAVDANVLIYERMREEQRAGRSPIPAIDAGFKRAFLTIVDSNLTTLIAALLLYWFGSGPIKGFAVTLTIGLLASMFTAISMTRLMVIFWVRRYRPKALPI